MPVEADNRRARYKKNKKQGCCPRCGKKKKKNSAFTYCDDCRAFFRGYNQKIAKRLNKVRKARYNERKEENCCPRCGIKLNKKYDKTICPSCLEKQYNYNYGKTKEKRKVKR